MNEQRRLLLSRQPYVTADVKYSSYVDIYNSLDGLIWRNMATFLGITVLGAGIMGTLLDHRDIAVIPLTHNQTVASAFLLVAIFYFMTIHIVRRMRLHHEAIESELRKLEPSGYFHLRAKSTKMWWLSAPTWVQTVFAILMVICVIASFFYFREGNQVTKTPLDEKTASAKYGISANHEIMENGELRFRLMAKDGNGYIRTVSVGGWQNSHSHKKISETYIVESGWMALAYESANGTPEIQILTPGDVVTTAINRVHNVYLPDGAIIHTVKHGSSIGENDWYPATNFHKVTKKLTELDLLKSKNSASPG